MSRRDEELALASEALEMIETGNSRLSPAIQRCLRLARLRGIDDAEQYFTCELRGYDSSYAKGIAWASLAAMSSRHAALDKDGGQTYWVMAVAVLENEHEMARGEMDALKMPIASISETAPDKSQYNYLAGMQQSTTEKVLNTILARRQTAKTEAARAVKILTAVRGIAQTWLATQVLELRYGSVIDSALDRTKRRVDAYLEQHAPAAAKALSAAFARQDSEEPEEWSQALTSCRRALKAVADQVYPPRGEEVDGHPMGEENYVNRLTQFAKERMESNSQQRLLQSEIDSVWDRADRLNDLANKGVHDEVTARDLDMAVVRTYLLAGDLLGLLEPADEGAEEPPAAEGQQAVAPGDDDGMLPELPSSADGSREGAREAV